MTKNSFRKSFFLLFGAACSATALDPLSAQADGAPPSSAPLQKSLPLQWMTQAGIDYILNAVPPPPAPGSDEEKADFQAVLKAQAARHAGDTNEIQVDQAFKIQLLIHVLSPDFTPRNYPLTFALLGQVQEETRLLNDEVKARYQRHRLYQDRPEIKKNSALDSSGYPSEFAAESRMLVLVLSELFPFQAGDLLDRDLVLAPRGVAYPSDITAGRALAHAFLFVIQDNPDFKRDLARAQAEIAGKTSGAAPGK